MNRRTCPGCGAVRGAVMRGQTVHLRTCARAFENQTPVRVEIQLDSITGSSRSLASLQSQADREAALRRALCGACPRVPFGLISGLVSKVVQLDLELEAKGEDHR